ncbi:MAG TPA: UvrD-helicase domain-containing protein [Candidatus Paceibacterota bacterium]|nr:UvrD-helicase domain-containing protein [Candidatus Paceibacterota bacterium]
MNSSISYLESLNPRQKEAVLHTEGPLLILAGAGAGKTKTITHRILHLIHQGVRPSQILAITFTNKAAKEMRERTIALLRKDALADRSSIDELPFISTFHSLGVHILKENASSFGFPRHFCIFDRSDSKKAIKDAMETLMIDSKRYDPGLIMSLISKEKGQGNSFDDFALNASSNHMEQITLNIWREYEKILATEKAFDFDDLLLKTLNLLKKEEIRKRYQSQWKYIHVDEYQDTNKVQYQIMKLLSEEHQNIAVVGDIDQCLIAGTKITMANGLKKNIEDISVGDMVLSNFGSGDYRGALVTDKFEKSYSGNMVEIITDRNKSVVSTPEHIHFAGFMLNASGDYYFTYLMYKEGKGYRLGISRMYTAGQRKKIAGFIQRCNQEHGSKIWILACHNNANDARVLEYILSLKYAIPTFPFVARKSNRLSGEGIVQDQKIIDKIFEICDTENSGKRLLEEYNLSLDYPHHFPQSRNSNRRNLNMALCGDHRGKTPMHRISMIGNDEVGKRCLELLGLSVRSAKRNSKSWRMETARGNFQEIMDIVSKINTQFENLNIIRTARLGGCKQNSRDGNSLSFIPAASIRPGMAMFNDKGEFEVVKGVTQKQVKKAKVYDLNIDKTHNFITNGIVTHNSIYSWRGADFKNIMRFEKDYRDVKEVLLEENYRSTKNIIAVSNAIIAKNVMRKEKNVFTQNPDGDKLTVHGAYNEREEAHYVARTAKMLIRQGVRPEEIAVLYRANFQSRAIEEACLQNEVPYTLLGTKFFERKEVKDVLAYLKAALNPDSISDFKRAISFPSRGIGKVTLLKILEGKGEELPKAAKEKLHAFQSLLRQIKNDVTEKAPSQIIKDIILHSGIQSALSGSDGEDAERLENIKELVTIAAGYDDMELGKGMEEFLEHVALSSDQDDLKEEKKGVRLMTVHASKGLEFDYVFITGLEQDLFPHSKMNEREAHDTEEERRLFYVALTRARKKVYLTYANIRTIFGQANVTIPSEFVLEIDDRLLEIEGGEMRREKIIYLDF